MNFFPIQIDVLAFRQAWGNNASFKIRAPWSSGIWHCAVPSEAVDGPLQNADAVTRLEYVPSTRK